MINQPRLWSTIFITQRDRRSFIEACLERSHPAPVYVMLNAFDEVPASPSCSCDEDDEGKLFPNEIAPCEWHFQYECLAEPKYSRRIRTLEICFDWAWEAGEGMKLAALESCRIFPLPFPRLTTLKLHDRLGNSFRDLFSTPPFPPSLRSLTYLGELWDDTITSVNNLTSFFFKSRFNDSTDVEAIRLFMLNNQSLESLEFQDPQFVGISKGPPVDLLNLKSLSVDTTCEKLPTIIRVPTLGRLSSLQVTSWGYYGGCTLCATGDGITFSTESLCGFAMTWRAFTVHARPVLHHVRLDGRLPLGGRSDYDAAFASALANAHTLEIGSGYFPFWYKGFREDLEQLWPQLEVIRFAIPDDPELTEERDGDEADRDVLLDQIEDLVRYRFEHGRPFSAVERMVVGGSEQNRRLDYVWRSFYVSRKLGQYVRPT